MLQTIEIQSAHDLAFQDPQARRSGDHSYKLHCGQFSQAYVEDRRHGHAGPTLWLMTLSMDRIWVTAQESEEIANAIRESRRSVRVD